MRTLQTTISLTLLLMATWANAGLVTLTNSTGGVVDSSSITQGVNVTAGDLAGFTDSIIDINLTVDFSKCSSTQNINGCVGEGGSTFSREIVFNLGHIATTVSLVAQDTFSGQDTSARVTQTYDDEAASTVGGALLLNGDFQPIGSLSDFDGMSALGLWEFTFEDTVGSDGLVVHSWSLNIELNESTSNNVPEPISLLLLGLGLTILSFFSRKKA